MNLVLVLLYAVSLSMDAFAVSVCKGLSLKKVTLKDSFIVGLYFGAFQGLMPLAGYFLASSFSSIIENFDHWIAFGLLLYIGGKMVWESFHPEKEDEKTDKPLGFKNMLILAIATSIDALAVGIAFSCDGMRLFNDGLVLGVFAAAAVIALTTFTISAFGTKLGRLFGSKAGSRAELAGGIVLVLLGVKILIEHLMDVSILGI